MPEARGLTLFDTALGACGLAWSAAGVCATQLPDATPQATAARLARRAPGAAWTEPPPEVAAVAADIQAMLSGEPRTPDGWRLDFGDPSALPRRVYAALLAIPYGRTRTYGEIARELGDVRLSQAVGRALGANPLPILAPCHRVLGAGGQVGGFSAGEGAATKLRLLNIERATTGGAPGLFGALPLAARPVSLRARDTGARDPGAGDRGARDPGTSG